MILFSLSLVYPVILLEIIFIIPLSPFPFLTGSITAWLTVPVLSNFPTWRRENLSSTELCEWCSATNWQTRHMARLCHGVTVSVSCVPVSTQHKQLKQWQALNIYCFLSWKLRFVWNRFETLHWYINHWALLCHFLNKHYCIEGALMKREG